MIHVDIKEPTDAPWAKWKAKAQVERKELLKAKANGRKRKVKDLYKDKVVKALLVKAFHGKCAYCESRIIELDQPGDIEHFRPKGRITDEHGRVISFRPSNGRRRRHPGYYWLAYDWRNLLLACVMCNRPSKRPSGQLTGKWDQFRVRSFRAVQPGDEAREQPLFLNPTVDEPKEHITIDENGVLGGLTEEGTYCIKTLGLNREGLVQSREAAYRGAEDKFDAYVSAAKNGATEKAARLKGEIEAAVLGKFPYTAAARIALAKKYETFNRAFDTSLFSIETRG